MLEEEVYQLERLEDWVDYKCTSWRDNFEANYSQKFDEYYRLWRGQWSAEDMTRQSERSRIIAPALQQAVESSVAELEEATFGRGKWFDIKDDIGDTENADVALLRENLVSDFGRNKIRKNVAECLINAAVFGTGIAEIELTTEKEMAPATQPVMGGELTAVGVTIKDKTCVKLNPVMPQNFLIDPAACSVEEALGCAIDEHVTPHLIEELQEKGIYKKIAIRNADTGFELEEDITIISPETEKTRRTTYYGKVPRILLERANREEGDEVVSLTGEEETKSLYVEAIIVLVNGGDLLKAEENPYMMQDRPIVAFPWDIVPGRFWGRGICEKGYNSQKALDAELRARQDALALTVHPMIGIDSTRIPRGMDMSVRPGKTILTIGRPSEVLEPIRLGGVDQITFAQAESLQRMLQMATGAIDSAGIPGSINGEATAAGISMSLGAIIKRHKRTLINFQESFIIPFIEKAAWRYMQFDPESYPVKDYKFSTSSSLGIIAREYEVTQLVQLLQTMPADSPLYPILIQSIIDNMSLSNREELKEALKQAQAPSPEAQQMQQAVQESQMAFQKAQTDALTGQAAESMARAQKYAAEIQMMPEELQLAKLESVTKNLPAGNKDDKDFEKRLQVADVLLREREVSVKERK